MLTYLLDVRALTASPVVRLVLCLTCILFVLQVALAWLLSPTSPQPQPLPVVQRLAASFGPAWASHLGQLLSAQGIFILLVFVCFSREGGEFIVQWFFAALPSVCPTQVLLFIIMSDDNSEEDTRIAEISACRWPILALPEQAPSSAASGPYADAYGALDPPIRTIEVNVCVNERSICFFDITSGHTIQDLLDASEDPGCASVTTCFRVTRITVHTTAIALGCAERPPDFITPPSSDDEG